MPDWIGSDGAATAERYRLMAVQQLRGVSPSYEAVCLGVAGDADVLARLETLPAAKRQPNLLLGAVRFLGGPVGSWPAFREFVRDRWDEVAATMLARRTQTNEAARCATLLPALALLPQPLALLEVGASAGLCLYPDRYAYRYAVDGRVHAVGDGPVLDCAVTGPAPLPDRLPEVAWRAGLDLNPLDVTDDEDLRWLEALIWPEQRHRLDVLHAAAAVARADPPDVRVGDLTRDLAARAAQAPADATLVVFHSAVLAYVEQDGRAAFESQLDAIRADRPVYWLSNEAPGVVATVENDPAAPARFVLALDRRPLARTGPHGTSVEWLGSFA